MKHRLLLLFVLMLFVFSSCDFFRSKNLFNSGEDDTETLRLKKDSAQFVDSIRSLENNLQQIQQKHSRLLDSIKKAHKTEPQGYKYHIIVGGFKNPEYLNSYNIFIQDKGFKTTVIENEYGFKLISVESYKNWNTAANALENIKKDVEENAWIYIRG